MNRIPLTAAAVCAALALVVVPARSALPATVPAASAESPMAAGSSTVLLAWNDLGMHCISPRFREMAILPPANTIWALAIRRGEEPHIITSGVRITYSFPANTTVRGKTDFWTYAPKLFGQDLPLGVGLTGNKLAGSMKRVGDHFEATAVPVLPITDAGKWSPYQIANIRLNGQAPGIRIVVPVSEEMHCDRCHKSGGVAARGISAPTVDANILTLHDRREGTTLMARRPVLCASCHSDNALGTPGKAGVKSMSLAMHDKHAALADPPGCYDCHPGPKTQCNRSGAPGMRPMKDDPRCDRCHGDLTRMAAGLRAGRKPWLEEPTCAQCHGAKFSTGTTLYRQAKGHGGVYCIACHGSPHAWWPSRRADDNALPMLLQKNNHAIGYNACFVCHTDGRKGRMPPHGEEGEDSSARRPR